CLETALASTQCDTTNLQSCFCTNEILQANVSICVLTECNYREQVVASNLQAIICEGVPQPSRSNEIIHTIIVLSAFTFPILCLRCFSRWSITRQLWWDDWMAVLAGVRSPLQQLAKLGLGRHVWNVRPVDSTPLLKYFYAAQILYSLAQVLAKLSILLLYLRIFPRPKFRLATYIAIAVLIIDGIVYMLVPAFECLPVRSVWDRSVPGKCLNLPAIIYTGASTGIIMDFVIICLPISELKTLNLTLRKKITLGLMFSVGSFACITSIIRLKYLAAFGSSFDVTWDNTDVVMWSFIELATAEICACLPTIRPLLVHYIPSIFQSTIGSKNNTTTLTKGYKPRVPPKLSDGYNGEELMSDDEGLVNETQRPKMVRSKVPVMQNNSYIELGFRKAAN
ncbi:hypothetical protein BGZ57DRAFT_772220, partial [Hyaloscypha finlandica]